MLVLILICALSVSIYGVDVKCLINENETGIQSALGLRKCRVPGGHVCAQGNWPWLVFINVTTPFPAPDSKGKKFIHQYCTGTIISEHYVLTAAHCVIGPTPHRLEKTNTTVEFLFDPLNIDLIIGTVDYTDKNSITSRAATWNVNLNYSIIHRHDIAIIRLNKPLRFQTAIQPITLLKTFIEQSNDAAHVAGWGKIIEEFNNKSYSFKQTTKCHENMINLQTPDDCNRKYNYDLVDKNTQICAGGSYRGIHEGDSGGPLMINRKGKWYQIAISSMLPNKYTTEFDIYPPIFTRVSYYCDWIEEITKKAVQCERLLLDNFELYKNR
uniref:Peptidase S1 domain-containing protein n=1 Tax=Acrobeloides nanus TaxID=290746 RepID=A0A914D1M2_9BILA